MNIYLLSCFLVRKILNNYCYYEEVVLRKSYFHGDTKHIFFIFINALEECSSYRPRVKPSWFIDRNDVTTSSSEHQL